ncbi:hypothetical protein HN903_04295 [archaeon]|jgi:hypothetical protein|nr:hypothetical protein [archaeon]MBT7128951.1 hypothetical protein [archaeon]
MKFKWHLLFGFTISYILIQFFNFTLSAGLTIFIASWIIDIDHYFWYLFELKDKNPFKALRWYNKNIDRWFAISFKEREKFKRGIFVFHSIGFWILLFTLSSLHPIFLWMLIGIGIHMAADFPHLIYHREPLYNKIFLSAVIRRNKNKKSLREL